MYLRNAVNSQSPSDRCNVCDDPPGQGLAGDIMNCALMTIEQWFARRGWEPFPFQREVWQAYLAGESGLIHATNTRLLDLGLKPHYLSETLIRPDR